MRVLRALSRMMDKPEKNALKALTAISALQGVCQGLTVLILLPIANALSNGDTGALTRWLIILAVAGTVTALLSYGRSMRGFSLAVSTMSTLHLRLGNHLIQLPMGWFNRRLGELTSLVTNGALTAGGSVGLLLVPLVTMTSTSITIGMGLIAIDWKIGATVLGAGIIVWFAVRAAESLMEKGEREAHASTVEINSRLVEFAQAQGALRAAGSGVRGYAPLSQALDAQGTAGKKGLWFSSLALGLNSLAAQIAFSALVVMLVVVFQDGTISAIHLIALFMIVSSFIDPLSNMGLYRGSIRAAEREIGRIQEVLDAPVLADSVQSGGAELVQAPSIEFDGVTFGYSAEQPVLRDLTFRAEGGTTTAIVGVSGAGKTTILRLIARFFDVDDGRILINGSDIRDLPNQELMDSLSVIFQDVYLFDDTLHENVRIGNPSSTNEQLLEIAKLSGVEEIVTRLPEGWETPVGEGGSRLSGGERQRVSIARALLKQARILLVDEATAALDPENEKIVSNSLGHIREKCTVLVIAHRLATIVDADQIIMLDPQGQVAEIGTHQQLMAKKGAYSLLWRELNDARGWTLTS